MKYGLSEKQLQEIKNVLASYEEVDGAILFGSRAIDTYKEASDIDIAIKGEKADFMLAAKIKGYFEDETYLPFFFDIISYNSIDNDELKKHIKTKGKFLYRKGWRTCRLGEVAETNLSTINKTYPHKNIEYLDTGSITCGIIENLQPYDLSEAPSRAKRIVSHEDIIYSTVRPIQRHYGFIEKPKENLIVSTGFTVITCNKNEIEPKFLYYIVSSDETTEILDIIAEASTSTYPSLKPSDIENLEILLPPLQEQKAIGEVLSSLDDKIDLLHRQNKTLESLAETLFRHHFIDNAQPDWELEELGKYVNVVDNRGKTPPNQKEITPYPVIEVNALGKESRLVDYSVIRKYVDKETFENWFRANPKKYDTLISTVGSIGELSMFLVEKGNIAQNVIALQAKEISPFYIYQILKYKKEEVMQLDIGGVQPSIKVPHLLSIIIPIPKIEVQNAFDEQMIAFTNKIKNNQKQIQTLENLRDTILPKLISGDVRVQYNINNKTEEA